MQQYLKFNKLFLDQELNIPISTNMFKFPDDYSFDEIKKKFREQKTKFIGVVSKVNGYLK